ncbi:AMP-binding protein [Allonocardiopsis opalescens]|uniref:Amino acid adenylation domain-containing protein n=1 Tax=Allonocardiopsis opalescens TaxID=1144618 RepID=A0A2T0QD21_9ACTN|nr:AMP-binding protein [Allonocardiopsis opalescens]PRY01760.1 amino acid adenylation domain-containing protein [Allonocardiopsis opalescens]
MDGFADATHGDPEPDHPWAGLVPALLDDAAAREPAARAVTDAGGSWTYAELSAHSRAFDRWLRDRGVAPGERVVVRVPTGREQVAMLYGTVRGGAVFVPLNAAMKPYHLRSVIGNAEPRLIVVDDGSVEMMRGLGPVPVYGLGEVWEQVAALAAEGAEAEPARISAADIAVLVYTSGSTSAPKAVICPHAQMTFATRSIAAVLRYRPDDVVFCRFPISWDYGLYKVLLATLAGAELVLADGEADLLLLKRIRECGATVVPIVPSFAQMITTLARRESEPVTTVRMFTNTGAALSDAATEELRRVFPGSRVVRQFGQTECKRVSIMPPEEERERPQSVGLPLPGTRVAILDEDGRPVPAGRTGEIVVTGPHVMPGYWRAPELTAASFRPDPETGGTRLHTGDYGRLDEDGYLYFDGRRDDMFKRKGIRMSTLEIEAAALDIPGVHAAAAVPPSGRRDLALCVETELAPHTVLKELAGRLEPAKVPASCHVFDRLPLTSHGKNERAKLAELLDGGAR